jgi:hypothetical protein
MRVAPPSSAAARGRTEPVPSANVRLGKDRTPRGVALGRTSAVLSRSSPSSRDRPVGAEGGVPPISISTRPRFVTALAGLAVLFAASVFEAPDAAADVVTNCGPSGGHTLCLTAPSDILTREVTITVTNSPNTGKVIFTWKPDNKKVATFLQTSFVSNPSRPQNYTFVWPTQKYPDAAGSLQAQFGSTASEIVSIPLTLSNGGFQANPVDWSPPAEWTGASDPVVAAAGDGASNEKSSNAVIDSIVKANPALFLYLGDVYEEGTYTEFRNHYGLSAVDDPTHNGTLWGRLAPITESVLGNHETHNQKAFFDYWHRSSVSPWPMFEFGGVWFFDLWSAGTKFQPGSAQYNDVQTKLQSLPQDACVVAFWHRPVLVGTQTRTALLPMWQLLANNGGDFVLNGDAHFMAQYNPLDADLQPDDPSSSDPPDAHMVQLISGAGGHALAPLAASKSDPARIAWTPTVKQSGAVYLTLNGAANGGTATSISFDFRDAAPTANTLASGSVDCADQVPASPAP